MLSAKEQPVTIAQREILPPMPILGGLPESSNPPGSLYSSFPVRPEGWFDPGSSGSPGLFGSFKTPEESNQSNSSSRGGG
ncbi:MAG: hypothetical protein FWH17_03220 [Oscillospiraceae bacterium]|nr:hypothetical protein [Oscillospiraceae bacterium]